MPIPEEWKSGRRVHDSHLAQLGTYFLLIEEEIGIRPPHGYVVLGDGRLEVVRNTDELRTSVLCIADEIRTARRHMAEIIQVSQPPAKCRGCGVRVALRTGEGIGQALPRFQGSSISCVQGLALRAHPRPPRPSREIFRHARAQATCVPSRASNHFASS